MFRKIHVYQRYAWKLKMIKKKNIDHTLSIWNRTIHFLKHHQLQMRLLTVNVNSSHQHIQWAIEKYSSTFPKVLWASTHYKGNHNLLHHGVHRFTKLEAYHHHHLSFGHATHQIGDSFGIDGMKMTSPILEVTLCDGGQPYLLLQVAGILWKVRPPGTNIIYL